MADSQSRLERIKSRLNDAWAHATNKVSAAMKNEDVLPVEEAKNMFINEVAFYLEGFEDILHESFEHRYNILKTAVEKALEVRDPSGATLGEYEFTSHSAGHIKELQEILKSSLEDSNNKS